MDTASERGERGLMLYCEEPSALNSACLLRSCCFPHSACDLRACLRCTDAIPSCLTRHSVFTLAPYLLFPPPYYGPLGSFGGTHPCSQ